MSDASAETVDPLTPQKALDAPAGANTKVPSLKAVTAEQRDALGVEFVHLHGSNGGPSSFQQSDVDIAVNSEVASTAGKALLHPVVPAMSFGQQMAQERQRQGLTVGDVAAQLRLHQNQIRAIEAEDFSALPGMPYARGFIRNYARALGMSPQPFLDHLQQLHSAEAPRLQGATRSAVALARTGGMGNQAISMRWHRVADTVARPLVLIGAVVAILGFALLGWYSRDDGAIAKKRSSFALGAAATALVSPTDAGSQSSAGMVNAPDPGEPARTTATALVEAMVPSAPTGAHAVADVQRNHHPRDGELLLSFGALAWVEVAQADGRVVLSQNNPLGSVQLITGKPPYRVVIGNAAAVRIEYQGRDVDLRPYTRDNVARLTIE